MNFLALCQRACVECGVASNTAVATALPTVVGATGSVGRIVNWVNDAWTDIQMDHDDWEWMRASQILGSGVSFTTVNGQFSYPLGTGAGTVGVLADNFGKWVEKDPDGSGSTFWNYATASGFSNEIRMAVIPFGRWRTGYMANSQRNTRTRPVVVSVGPDLSLNLGPCPNDQYTITGDYYVAPSQMVNDSDTLVGLPARFNMLPVYRTMMKYGGYESAPEVYQRGSEENAGMYAQLQAVRAPEIAWAGALA